MCDFDILFIFFSIKSATVEGMGERSEKTRLENFKKAKKIQ